MFLPQKALLVAATLLGISSCGARSVDLNDTREYTLVRSFDGRLNPVDGPIHAEVFVLDRRPYGNFDDPIRSNIIEVSSEKGTARFMFPSNEPLGAGVVEIADLDNDGWMEFVFIKGTHVRVVSYGNGNFSYRSDRDVLFGRDSIRFLIASGRPQLVMGGPVVIKFGDTGELPAALEKLAWSKEVGFVRSPACCR